MGWFSVLCWCFVVIYAVAAHERENGILYDHTAVGLETWNRPEDMKNTDFPNLAPHDLVQTWRWVAWEQPGQQTAIKIICNRIFIPKAAGRNDCGEYKLTIEDGRDRRELCGDVGPFVTLSSSSQIIFEMHTGPSGGGIVDCIAMSVAITPDRREIPTTTTTTTSTTTTPKPTSPAYMTLPSEEVDSFEHGVDKGVKSTTCNCGWANKNFGRIVNGTETERNEFPFAAGLTYRGSRDRFCGATIITRYHALTAAHCTYNDLPEYLSLLVGIHNVYNDWHETVDEIPIEQIVNHDGFVTGIWSNDIALLVLEREIKFNQFVGPACLPPVAPRLQLDRKYIKIIGWGATEFQGEQSDILNKVNVRVVPMKECNFMYSYVRVENPLQICTYAKQKAACQGDSGGPVMWVDPETNRYTHVGIVSFGRVCGDISPTVHTSVQAYLDWIHHYIRASNKPNSQTCTKIN